MHVNSHAVFVGHINRILCQVYINIADNHYFPIKGRWVDVSFWKKNRDIILCYVLVHLKTNILFSFSYKNPDSKDNEPYILGHLNNGYHVGMIVNSKFKKKCYSLTRTSNSEAKGHLSLFTLFNISFLS